MTKTAVIGARGYIGRHLCAALRATGDDVVEVSSAAPGGIDPLTGLLPGDFEFVGGIDAAVYLAQSPWVTRGDERPVHVLAANVVSAVAAAAAARRAGARRFVYASTGNVYAPSFAPLVEDAALRTDNWYSLSKVQAEQALALLRTPAFDVHSLRLFGVYGPGQTDRLVANVAGRVRQGRRVTLAPRPDEAGDGSGLRVSLTHVDDVATVFAVFARSGGPDVCNVAGPQALSIREIATLAGELLGCKPVFEAAAEARPGDLVADTRLLERTLAPRFRPFESGLASMLAAWTPA